MVGIDGDRASCQFLGLCQRCLAVGGPAPDNLVDVGPRKTVQRVDRTRVGRQRGFEVVPRLHELLACAVPSLPVFTEQPFVSGRAVANVLASGLNGLRQEPRIQRRSDPPCDIGAPVRLGDAWILETLAPFERRGVGARHLDLDLHAFAHTRHRTRQYVPNAQATPEILHVHRGDARRWSGHAAADDRSVLQSAEIGDDLLRGAFSKVRRWRLAEVEKRDDRDGSTRRQVGVDAVHPRAPRRSGDHGNRQRQESGGDCEPAPLGRPGRCGLRQEIRLIGQDGCPGRPSRTKRSLRRHVHHPLHRRFPAVAAPRHGQDHSMRVVMKRGAQFARIAPTNRR